MSVAVSDSKSGEAFELVLSNNNNALDVFHHPYAYAASRRPDLGVYAREDCAPAVEYPIEPN